MKSRPSFIMAAMAMLAGASFAASNTALTINESRPVAMPGSFIGRGSGRTKRKVKGGPSGGSRKRRKNPFRGTTYARIIGVPSHY